MTRLADAMAAFGESVDGLNEALATRESPANEAHRQDAASIATTEHRAEPTADD
jgi:hypothetical protein